MIHLRQLYLRPARKIKQGLNNKRRVLNIKGFRKGGREREGCGWLYSSSPFLLIYISGGWSVRSHPYVFQTLLCIRWSLVTDHPWPSSCTPAPIRPNLPSLFEYFGLGMWFYSNHRLDRLKNHSCPSSRGLIKRTFVFQAKVGICLPILTSSIVGSYGI